MLRKKFETKTQHVFLLHIMEKVVRKFYGNGNLRQEFAIINFNKEGVYKEYYEDGTLYIQCNYYRNKLEGLRTEYYRSGRKYIESSYLAGKKHGVHKEFYDSEYIHHHYCEINYVAGVKDGKYRMFCLNGSVAYEYTYKNNKKNGTYKKWWDYKNSILQYRSNYVDDKENGLRVEWNCDGSYFNISYIKNDKWCSLKYYVREQTDKYKEELMATVYHPDRLERFAANAGMETMDYMDLVLPR